FAFVRSIVGIPSFPGPSVGQECSDHKDAPRWHQLMAGVSFRGVRLAGGKKRLGEKRVCHPLGKTRLFQASDYTAHMVPKFWRSRDTDHVGERIVAGKKLRLSALQFGKLRRGILLSPG